MNTHLLALYVAAVFLAMIAPGPDMMFILSTGMRGGARAGLLATLGVVSSEVVQIAAVAAGLSALFAEAPLAFTALRLGEAAYPVPRRAGVAQRPPGQPAGRSAASARVSGRYAYVRGLLATLANPNRSPSWSRCCPQFVRPRPAGTSRCGSRSGERSSSASKYVVNGAVGLASGRIGSWLSQRRRARQALDAGSGTIMVALAGRLALER